MHAFSLNFLVEFSFLFCLYHLILSGYLLVFLLSPVLSDLFPRAVLIVLIVVWFFFSSCRNICTFHRFLSLSNKILVFIKCFYYGRLKRWHPLDDKFFLLFNQHKNMFSGRHSISKSPRILCLSFSRTYSDPLNQISFSCTIPYGSQLPARSCHSISSLQFWCIRFQWK